MEWGSPKNMEEKWILCVEEQDKLKSEWAR